MPAQSGNDVRHHIYISQAMRKQDKRLHLLLKNLLASVEWRDGSCSLSGWRYGWLGSLHPSVGDKGGGQVAPGVGAVHCRLFRRVCVCVYSRITSSHDDEEPSLRLGSLPRLRVMVKKKTPCRLTPMVEIRERGLDKHPRLSERAKLTSSLLSFGGGPATCFPVEPVPTDDRVDGQ